MSVEISQIVRGLLRDIPNFPEPGVQYWDITPLIGDGPGFQAVTRDIASRNGEGIDVVAGLEARGFIFGAAVAHELGLGFVPIRKAGKLPGQTTRVSYELEYGSATLEIHNDGIAPGARVLVVDDVLATGGTAAAACEVIEAVGAQATAVEIVLELAFLNGRERLPGRDVRAILTV